MPGGRHPLRLALGKIYYINKRRLAWYAGGTRYATARSASHLPHVHMSHGTPMLRKLSGVDMQLQENKKASLEIAAACIERMRPPPARPDITQSRAS